MSRRTPKRKHEESRESVDTKQTPPDAESMMREMAIYVFPNLSSKKHSNFAELPKCLWTSRFFLDGPARTKGGKIGQSPLTLAVRHDVLDDVIPHIPQHHDFRLDGGLQHHLPAVIDEMNRRNPSALHKIAALFDDPRVLYNSRATDAICLYNFLVGDKPLEDTDRLLGVSGTMLDPDATFFALESSIRAAWSRYKTIKIDNGLCAVDFLMIVMISALSAPRISRTIVARVDEAMATLCANLPGPGRILIDISVVDGGHLWVALLNTIHSTRTTTYDWNNFWNIRHDTIQVLFDHLDNSGWFDTASVDTMVKLMDITSMSRFLSRYMPICRMRFMQEPRVPITASLICPPKRAHLRDRDARFDCTRDIVQCMLDRDSKASISTKCSWLEHHPLCIWQTWTNVPEQARDVLVHSIYSVTKCMGMNHVRSNSGNWLRDLFATWRTQHLPLEPVQERILNSRDVSEQLECVPNDRALWRELVPHAVVQSTLLLFRKFWVGSGDALCMHHKFLRGPGPGALGHVANAEWCMDAAAHFCGNSPNMDYRTVSVRDEFGNQVERRFVNWGYPEASLMKRTHEAWAVVFGCAHRPRRLQYLNRLGDVTQLIWGYLMLAEMYDWKFSETGAQ